MRSRRNKVFCLGTGNGQTEAFNVNCIKYFLYTCLLYIIVHRSHYKYQWKTVKLIKSSICLNSSCVDRKWRKTKWNRLNISSIKCLSSMNVLRFDHLWFLRTRLYKMCFKKATWDIWDISPEVEFFCWYNIALITYV